MRIETYVRFTELGFALASTYMVAVTMLQTSVYAKLKPYAVRILGPILSSLGVDPEFTDILVLGVVMTLSFLLWRSGWRRTILLKPR